VTVLNKSSVEQKISFRNKKHHAIGAKKQVPQPLADPPGIGILKISEDINLKKKCPAFGCKGRK
jgi:hypothetical protein